ncbi:MAG: hypothetical protein ABI831_10430 [Betaproteobacteria bacterium]
MLKTKFARMAALVIGGVLFAAGTTAFGHTTVRSQGTESVTEDNAFKIGHGCATPAGDRRPVIAQSVVFPTLAPVLTASDNSAVGALSTVIEQGGVTGLMSPVQDRSIFLSQQKKTDSLGNAIGFSSTYGMLDTTFVGRVPFQFAGPKFVANSCAKRLLVKIAIVDICTRGSGALAAGKLNMWIPANGSQYAIAGAAANIDGIGAPATLTINRNLTTNPLSASCGAGIDVTVTPSAADVDANLPIPGYWN